MKLAALFLLLFSIQAWADPKMAVHLLSYLAQDYGEAVQEGKVKNQSEYSEQQEFILEVLKTSKEQHFPKGIQTSIANLKDLIDKKSDVQEVALMANKIKWKIIEEYNIGTSPEQTPDLKRGKEIYQTECVRCHGVRGFGDGDQGQGLDPAPTNFHDKIRMSSVSPFQAFTTISLGVPGTGMQAYNHFSEHDRWSLAFYIHEFHLENIRPAIVNLSFIQEDLTSLSDNEILQKYYKGQGLKDEFLKAVRTINLKKDHSTGEYFKSKVEIAVNKLEKSLSYYAKKETGLALKFSLE